MSESVTLSLVRPYASEDELIAAEGWTIDKKGMVLIGQERLKSGTLVRFELLLEDGTRVLVAEGKASGYAKPHGDHPGGAKIRFNRFNASGKAFIDRVVAANAARAEAEAAPAGSEEPSAPEAGAAPADPDEPSTPEAAAEPPAEPVADESSPEAAAEPPAEPVADESSAPEVPSAHADLEPSGIRPRAAGPVAPPENREELLEKLRERTRRNSARDAEAADQSA